MKKASLYIMVALYVSLGINHFINPAFYQKIMPPYLPFHSFLIFISGVFEILFALFLLSEKTRRLGAWLIIGLLIAIFPANIQMMLDFWQNKNPHLWAAILRLPLQFVLIWWAWIYTKRVIEPRIKVAGQATDNADCYDKC